MSAAGAVRFARYAYPPNELGYCGPAGAGALLRPEAPAEIERRARRFEGAWSYLEFIAEACGIADPLDDRVVEAYWVGNDLLDRVDPGALVDRLHDRFRSQIGGTWRTAADRAVAHHSFQVFEVYPWAALLGVTGHPAALTVLDRCRVRTGRVLAVSGSTATVHTRPLRWDGAFRVGARQEETVRWSVGASRLIDRPAPGQRVALHWDWVCEVIGDEQWRRIEGLADRALQTVPR